MVLGGMKEDSAVARSHEEPVGLYLTLERLIRCGVRLLDFPKGACKVSSGGLWNVERTHLLRPKVSADQQFRRAEESQERHHLRKAATSANSRKQIIGWRDLANKVHYSP